MAFLSIKRFSSGILPILGLSILLLVSLYLMGAATRNTEEFGRLYILLLLINILGLILLIMLIAANLTRLVRQYRNKAAGSRLTVRLLGIFAVLALVPASVVYYFSLDFIQRGVDSWFDVRIEQAFDDALELSRISLDDRKREYLRRTNQLGKTLSLLPAAEVVMSLHDMRVQSDVHELTLLRQNGHIIGFSSANSLALLPMMPSEAVLRQVRQGTTYVGLDPIGEADLYIRIVLELPEMSPIDDARILQALYPVSGQMTALAENVEDAVTRYNQLAFLRGPLKYSFTLTLSLVLLLSLLTALWAAIVSARRLVAPIRVLAIGTRAVASGDYDRQLPQHSTDELGFLVRSFNDMTRRLSVARDEARLSQQQAESERAYLRAVLGRLSSGVLTLDRHRILRTANPTAGQILEISLRQYIGKPLVSIGRDHPHLKPLLDVIRPQLSHSAGDWRQEVIIYGASGRLVLMCGGASLSGSEHDWGGHVLVIDDVTALVQAQRDAAWGEVARRLAHEIKNPLTPIRLSAERLRHKYLATMKPEDAEVLDRSTHTIVQQVEVMKEMVKAFAEYARVPQLKLQWQDLNTLISEVLDLYRGENLPARFLTELDPELPAVHVDSGRIRQLLHNLIKNSLEATPGEHRCVIVIRTASLVEAGQRLIEMRIEDNGPGLPPDMLGRFFEPYITTKRKGSGLGLAIVKKIVEEHGGSVRAENADEGGALIIVRFPVEAGSDLGHDGQQEIEGRKQQ